MQKLANFLMRLPFRVTALVLAVILVGAVWAVVKLFPALNARTVAFVGAFAIAGFLAVTRGGRRRA